MGAPCDLTKGWFPQRCDSEHGFGKVGQTIEVKYGPCIFGRGPKTRQYYRRGRSHHQHGGVVTGLGVFCKRENSLQSCLWFVAKKDVGLVAPPLVAS